MATRRRRPRGHIEERPNGTFRAIVYAGTDPLTGKARRLKETAPDWNAAQEALTRLQRQVDERQHPRSSVTVGQVVSQWLEVARHEDSTRERYDQLIRLYIEPTFGAMAAGKVDAELLERFYARLLACRELCDGPASTPASRPDPVASLPGTLASPRTGLTPAGYRELDARLRHDHSFPVTRPGCWTHVDPG